MGSLALDDALAAVRNVAVERLRPTEHIPFADAAGRVLAEDVCADTDMPPFRHSAMDGYGVSSADLSEGVAQLTVIDTVYAGQCSDKSVGAGEAVYVATGAPIPTGVEQVVEQERCTRTADLVCVDARPSHGRHIRPKGEELSRGALVLTRGTVLTPARCALALACGRASIDVGGRVRVGVISTGSELVFGWQKPRPGQVRDVNGPLLASSLHGGGVDVVRGGRCVDSEAALAEVIRGLVVAGCQVIVSSAGVSVGPRDPVAAAAASLGFEQLFAGVELKPGHPMAVFTTEQTLWFALPGNPVAAGVCSRLFVEPALAAMQGARDPGPHWFGVKAATPIREHSRREHLRRVKLRSEKGAWVIDEVLPAGSARLWGLATAHALVRCRGDVSPGDVLAALALPGWPE